MIKNPMRQNFSAKITLLKKCIDINTKYAIIKQKSFSGGYFMKKSLAKIISVLLVAMLAFSATVCFAAAETTADAETSSINPTVSEPKEARDIYLVIDISGSMSGEPINSLKDAAKQFCGTMLNDTKAENRIAIVTYGTDVDTYSFSTDYAQLANTIDSFKAKGSTAMYDALMAVKEINEKYGNSAATKHVVVMADGLPNVGAVLSSGKYTNKDSSMYYKYGNAVYSTAAGMWPDYRIYSIGFFHSLSGSQLKYGKTLMKDIQNALYLEVFDADKLKDAFDGVIDKITDKNTEDNSGGDNNNTTAAPSTTTAAPTTAKPADNNDKKIPQTSGAVMGFAAAAVVMAAGIVIVSAKKRED